jgi:hypothetical protein
MAAATANVDQKSKDGVIGSQPVLASTNIYKGAPVFLKSSGKLAFSNDGTTNTLAVGDIFAGLAVEQADNSAGASSAIDVRVYQMGVYLLTFSDTITQADVGKSVYVNNVSDNSVFTVTSDTGQPQVTIGKIVSFETASTAYVLINGQVPTTAANA